MNNIKKFIAIPTVALIAAISLGSISVYASEVTGTLSSGISAGSQVSGTIGGTNGSGSTVSGTLGGNSGNTLSGTVSGGGGGGGSSGGGQQGQVLGASTEVPGLPNTGAIPFDTTTSLNLIFAVVALYGMRHAYVMKS